MPRKATLIMPTQLDLIVTADSANRSVDLRLLDAGVQLAYRRVNLETISIGHQQGLFDLRNFVRHYVDVDESKEMATVAEIGVCIAQEVLGREIFSKLWLPTHQRTLRIQLPGASDEQNILAAALARVPWEIGRPSPSQQTLGERALLVRVVHDMQAPDSQPLELAANEALRILFVFAEARGSRPLGAREERREMLRLFQNEIYPQRRVVAHFLTHGVTRQRLQAEIQENGGYHVVHWSGHGNLNLLELAKPGGAKDLISGQELLGFFTDAGGFLPRLFFLGACHSGDILRVKDWNDFLAVAQGKEPETRQAQTRDFDLKEQPGFTGTAHALLQGGVPSVVAMRYAVGDDYARELAVEFYRALFAHAQPKSAAAALTMARRSMLDGERHELAHFAFCDHATPVLYGAEQPGLTLVAGVSPAKFSRDRRLHQITELSTAGHEHFVGRTWELAGLGADFIGSKAGVEVKPVAVITGLGGMGKTALSAEALALWEARFEWVLLYQAKPNALGFDTILRDIHMKLNGELGRYHDHVAVRPADAIYREASAEFTGLARLERLTHNLIRALRDEPILLVLDNFETNLKLQAEPASAAGQPVWASQDPAWDLCLTALAKGLAGSPSRVLITCRHPLAALADGVAHAVLLGPLPAAEAALYLRAHPGLRSMAFGADAGEKALALRLLNASRFHPLLMDRLAGLATNPALRPQLLQALETLENTKDFGLLPALFATKKGGEKELTYLDDALASSLDQLIGAASPDARRLLWMIAMANEPVARGLLKGAWSGESFEQQKLRGIKQMLDRLPQLASKQQAALKTMSPEFRAMLNALPPEASPDIAPLLSHLVSVGLVMEERTGPEDDTSELTCHELVRERIRAWMAQHAQDRADLTENTILLAYAERLEAVFTFLLHEDMSVAIQAGSRALVYCVQAGDWDRLRGFAATLITSAWDPSLLEALIPHLKTAAESAPEGRPRWSCLCYLADALRHGSQSDVSLPFYEQAAAQARATAEAGGEGYQQAWADCAWITSNWADALGHAGHLDAARQRHLDSADATKKAGGSAIGVINNELAVLRLDIQQGKVEVALPEVEARLAKVDAWWRQHRSGQPVPDDPSTEYIARTLIAALDIAREAHFALKDWPSALRRIDAILEVKRALHRPEEDIANSRMNRANVLRHLGDFGAARAELEAGLLIFENDYVRKARTLGSLAKLFYDQGDVAQAITQERRALALFEQLPGPTERASSHGNLANYLERSGTLAALAEAPRHQFADLIYCLAAELGHELEISLSNYVIDFRRAHATGTVLAMPRVAKLLADPAFHPLEQWLDQHHVNVAELQADIDRLLEQARQAALS